MGIIRVVQSAWAEYRLLLAEGSFASAVCEHDGRQPLCYSCLDAETPA